MKLIAHGPGGPRHLENLLTNRLSALDSAQRGDLVVLRAWKYSGYAHWTASGLYLGQDEHGYWVAQPLGTFCTRPGMSLYSRQHCVVLIPHTEPWVATFHQDPQAGSSSTLVYVDVSAKLKASAFNALPRGESDPSRRRQAFEVDSFDMDLDVMASDRRGILIDDEDEFEEHAVLFGYPPELMEAMGEVAHLLYERMEMGREPLTRTSAAAARWYAEAAPEFAAAEQAERILTAAPEQGRSTQNQTHGGAAAGNTSAQGGTA